MGTFNPGTLNVNDQIVPLDTQITASSKVTYSSIFTSDDSTPTPVNVDLNLPADLFPPKPSLSIVSITPLSPIVNTPIFVSFRYQGRRARLTTELIDKEHNQTIPILSLITNINNILSFSYTPTQPSNNCVIRITALDSSNTVLTTIDSKPFIIKPLTAPPPPAPPLSLTIAPIHNLIPINVLTRVTFVCTPPTLPLEVFLEDVSTTNRTKILKITSLPATEFSYKFPKLGKYKIHMNALNPTTRNVLVPAVSNEFKVVPVSTIIQIPHIDDFYVSESRSITFDYIGQKVSEFEVAFFNNNNRNNSVITLPPSTLYFDFTAPKFPANVCSFSITAVLTNGQRITNQSNPFKINLPVINITNIPSQLVGSTLNVNFTYAGPPVPRFFVHLSTTGRNTNSPKISQSVTDSSKPVPIPLSNPNLVSDDCYVFVIPDLKGVSFAEFSNKFSITPKPSLQIETIPQQVMLGSTIKVKFNYTGPKVDSFKVEFIDTQNNTKINVTSLNPQTFNFNFKAEPQTTNCNFTFTAISNNQPPTQANSNNFSIVPLATKYPPDLTITPIPSQINVNDTVPVRFTYNSMDLHSFEAFFSDDGRNYQVIQPYINPSLRSFNFVAPNNPSKKCNIKIAAYDSRKIRVQEGISNQFEIALSTIPPPSSPKPQIVIDPISTQVPINTNLNVHFTYKGPPLLQLIMVGISDKGKTSIGPITGQSVKFNHSNNYNLTLNIPNNPSCISKNCYFFVDIKDKNVKLTEFSNPFEIVSSKPPPAPPNSKEPITIQHIPDLALNTRYNFNFAYNGNAKDFILYFSSYNSPFMQCSIIPGNERKFKFTTGILPSEKVFLKIEAYDSNNKVIAENTSNKFNIEAPKPPKIQIQSRDIEIGKEITIPINKDPQEFALIIQNPNSKGYIQYLVAPHPLIGIIHKTTIFGTKLDNKKYGSVSPGKTENILLTLRPMDDTKYNEIKSKNLVIDIITKPSGIKINTENLVQFKNGSITTKIKFNPQ